MNDELTKLVICGIVSKLRNIMQTQYRVRMKSLSDAYADDYYEPMVLLSDLLKVTDELESIIERK